MWGVGYRMGQVGGEAEGWSVIERGNQKPEGDRFTQQTFAVYPLCTRHHGGHLGHSYECKRQIPTLVERTSNSRPDK